MTSTEYITIGKNPALTIAIVQAIAERQRRKDRWEAFKSKIQFWKP